MFDGERGAGRRIAKKGNKGRHSVSKIHPELLRFARFSPEEIYILLEIV